MKRYFFIILFIIVIFVFGFWKYSAAQQNQIPTSAEAPETLEEAKFILVELIKNLPSAVKKIFIEEALPIWQKMYEKIKSFWNIYISARVKILWQKIKTTFEKKIEKKAPVIEKEFEKEKQELKKEIREKTPGIMKKTWEKLKKLIK